MCPIVTCWYAFAASACCGNAFNKRDEMKWFNARRPSCSFKSDALVISIFLCARRHLHSWRSLQTIEEKNTCAARIIRKVSLWGKRVSQKYIQGSRFVHFLALTFRETPARQSPAGHKEKEKRSLAGDSERGFKLWSSAKKCSSQAATGQCTPPRRRHCADAQCDTTVQVHFRRHPQGSVKIKNKYEINGISVECIFFIIIFWTGEDEETDNLDQHVLVGALYNTWCGLIKIQGQIMAPIVFENQEAFILFFFIEENLAAYWSLQKLQK